MQDNYYDKNFFKQRTVLNNYCRDVLKNGDEPETFSLAFKRSTKAFVLNLLFGYRSFLYLLMGLFVLALIFIGKTSFGYTIGFVFLGILIFSFLLRFIINIYSWKYKKNIVVTNNGIWIVTSNINFWQKKSYDGKRHLIRFAWSLYDWNELQEIKLYSDRISRTVKLSNIILCRWDGNEELPYLKQEDLNKLLEVTSNYIKPKRKKKKSKIRYGSALINFFKDVEKFYTGRKDAD